MGMSSSVRKAVFPAAGLGTRFLPATKAQPKEMLPLVDKPTIQYGVEEPAARGSRTSSWSLAGQERHRGPFRCVEELKPSSSRGKKDLADEVRKISNLINVSHVRQRALGLPRGARHWLSATNCSRSADDVIDVTPPALKQMIDVFERAGGPVLAERVPMDSVVLYDRR